MDTRTSIIGSCQGIGEDWEARSARERAKAAKISIQSNLKEIDDTTKSTTPTADTLRQIKAQKKRTETKITVKTSKIRFIPSHPPNKEQTFDIVS